MIVINNGVPKSGTTLINNFLIRLFNYAIPENGIEAWKNHNGNIFINKIKIRHLRLLKSIDRQHGSFIIKTHQPLNFAVRRLMKNDNAKMICCFRDPRDIMLSTIDHAIRTRKGLDKSGVFKDVYTLEDAVGYFKKEMSEIYYSCAKSDYVLMIKYEDFMTDKLSVYNRVANYLDIVVPYQEIEKIHKELEQSKTNMLNYNKGTFNRWKSEINPEQIEKFNTIFSKDLRNMGYSIK